jgi:hypothetical protein
MHVSILKVFCIYCRTGQMRAYYVSGARIFIADKENTNME